MSSAWVLRLWNILANHGAVFPPFTRTSDQITESRQMIVGQSDSINGSGWPLFPERGVLTSNMVYIPVVIPLLVKSTKRQKLGGGALQVLGGVNHTSLHCRLGKFRGLMIMRKYGDVIGKKISITCIFILGTNKKASFPANHIAVFPHDHQPWNVAKR